MTLPTWGATAVFTVETYEKDVPDETKDQRYLNRA